MADYRAIARQDALRNGIDPNVFLRQIQQESGFNPNARSGAGALGIAQFMPGTAAGFHINPMNPIQALAAAALMDKQNLGKYGSYARMLSAYNSGNPDAYQNPGFAGGQTYNYVRSILNNASRQAPSNGGFANPISNGSFARVDQGVDYNSKNPVGALGAGIIESITKGMAGGTGDIIKERLASPVTVNGHTYNQVYYSEQSPLVKVGQRVGSGQPVMAAGGNELGFLNQNGQMAPLVGGLGAGTKPTQMGQDFLTFVNSLGKGVQGPQTGTASALASAMQSGNVAQPTQNPIQNLIQAVMANNTALMQQAKPAGYQPF